VLCAGDSMTFGIGSTAHGDFPSRLEQLLNAPSAPQQPVVVFNAGIAGANTTMILDALPAYLDATAPDLLILLAGTANLSNFYGFQRWKGGDDLRATWQEHLFEIRVYRLAATAWARLARPMGTEGHASLHGTSAAVAAYERWWSRRGPSRPGDPLPEPFARGVQALRLGEFEQASELFAAGAARQPELSCFPWGQGMAAWGLRDEARAEAFFEQATERMPSDPNAYAALGEMLLPADAARAARWFERGVEADPSFSGNLWGLTMVQRRNGSPRAMLAAVQTCIAADPGDARCFAELRRLQGTPVFAEARTWLEDLAPHNGLARDALAALVQQDLGPAIDPWVDHDLRAMVALAQERGVAVLLQGYPDPKDPSLPLLKVSRELSLPYVDHHAIFQQEQAQRGDALLLPDGHCTDAGYELMARSLASAIQQRGLLPDPSAPAPEPQPVDQPAR